MTSTNVLPGCRVLPPMEPVADKPGTTDKAKGNPARRKVAGRFAVLNAFIDFAMRELSRGEIAVWLVLFRDTKLDGLARTSQTDMARRAGVDTRTVRRALDGLERAGLLAVVYRGGLRRGPSAYRVRPLKLEG